MLRLPVRTHFAPNPEEEAAKAARRRDRRDTAQLHDRIVALLKQGLPGYQVAEECGVSPTTVSKHRRGYIKTTNSAKRAKE